MTRWIGTIIIKSIVTPASSPGQILRARESHDVSIGASIVSTVADSLQDILAFMS